MIGYLEQLERDLVEAIDRREAARPVSRAIRSRRRQLRAAAILVAVLLAGVIIGIAIHAVRDQSREIPATPPRPTSEPTPPPLPQRGSASEFGVRGNLVRFPDGSWRGAGSGTGIPSGSLKVTGQVEFRNLAEHPIRWEWVTAGGRIAGCVTNTMYRRPGGRWVWDGTGNVKSASGVFSRWRGIPVGWGGRTYVDDRDHAYLALDDLRPVTRPREPRRLGAFKC